MTDDRLLRDLGNLARRQEEAEQARFDERWNRLAAGTLTAAEEAELKALAESSPEAREAYEAFRPLGAGFQARMVDAAAAELASEAPKARPEEPRPRLLPFRRAVTRAEVWLGTAAALAAGLFFLVRSPVLPPLPPYALDPIQGDQTVRGGKSESPNGIPVFDPDSRLMLIARPPHPVTAPAAAQAFLAHGAELLPWQPGEPGTAGSFRFEGGLSQFQPGEWKVWVVVGHPGRIPSASELQTRLQAGRTRTTDWQAISTDLRIRARASP